MICEQKTFFETVAAKISVEEWPPDANTVFVRRFLCSKGVEAVLHRVAFEEGSSTARFLPSAHGRSQHKCS
jgi:hypothetical protein